MSKGVIKSFRKHLESSISFILNLKHDSHEINLKEQLHTIVTSIDLHDKQIKDLFKVIHESGASITEDELRTAWEQSYSATRKDTHQAMEAFIHNLNTMHSRGGNQVVFSSINYGTDTSAEGRMVIRELLAATVEGLGNGEVPVFPIQIFKVKDGISYDEEDYKMALAHYEDAINGKIKFKAPILTYYWKHVKRPQHPYFPISCFWIQSTTNMKNGKPTIRKGSATKLPQWDAGRAYLRTSTEKKAPGAGEIFLSPL